MGPTPRARAAGGLAAPGGGVGPSGSVFASSSVLWKVPRKIGALEKTSSDSENISLSTFLKPKIAENRELALWHLVNRLVPENA